MLKNTDDPLNVENLQEIANLINVRKSEIIEYDDFMANVLINSYTGVNIDSVFSYPASLIVKQYLIPLIKALALVDKDDLIVNNQENKFLQKYADSLLYNDVKSDEPYSFQNETKRLNDSSKIFFSIAHKYNSSLIYNTGLSLYRYYLKLNNLTKANFEELKSGIESRTVKTKLGMIGIGGTGNDTYEGNYILIIDLGGNDKYILEETNKNLSLLTPIKIIADLSGNDTYIGGDYSLGGAYFGINLLFDYSGDDNYTGGNISLGSANFGVGILHDFEGNDTYTGKNLSQGAAAFGIGILYDKSGNDVYNSHSYSQGFGFTAGIGILADKKGNDNYLSSSISKDALRYSDRFLSFCQGAALGYRPLASGGLGLLFDYDGNDNYTADIYAQGTGYWYSCGGIVDYSGNDRYQAHQYAQGSGVHFAFGSLIDLKGSDIFTAGSVSQGCGHDFAYGALFSLSGNDRYSADGLSLGGGNANAISLFLDRAGDDSYMVVNKSNSMGYSDFRRSMGMIGVFIDSHGTDSYCDTLKNNQVNHKSTYGLCLDISLPTGTPVNTSVKKSEENFKLPADSKKLFIIASNQLDAYQDFVVPARDALAEQGENTIKVIKDNLHSTNPRTYQAIEQILTKMSELGKYDYFDDFSEYLSSDNRDLFSLFSRIYSKSYPGRSYKLIERRRNSKDWRIREIALHSLVDIKDSINIDVIKDLLNDEHPFVRARAAYLTGFIKNKGYLETLRAAFIDEQQVVKYSAYQGVLRGLNPDIEFAEDLLAEENSLFARKMLIGVFEKAELNDKELKKILGLLSNQELSVRKSFYEKIVASSRTYWKKKLSLILKSETEQSLKDIFKNEK